MSRKNKNNAKAKQQAFSSKKPVERAEERELDMCKTSESVENAGGDVRMVESGMLEQVSEVISRHVIAAYTEVLEQFDVESLGFEHPKAFSVAIGLDGKLVLTPVNLPKGVVLVSEVRPLQTTEKVKLGAAIRGQMSVNAQVDNHHPPIRAPKGTYQPVHIEEAEETDIEPNEESFAHPEPAKEEVETNIFERPRRSLSLGRNGALIPKD